MVFFGCDPRFIYEFGSLGVWEFGSLGVWEFGFAKFN